MLAAHYGYLRRTTGADEDQVDVFVREGIRPNYRGPVFVVNQLVQSSGEFDEHKVMLGWADEDEARAAYLENFPPGWKVGPIKSMSLHQFKHWLRDGDTTAIAKVAGTTPIQRAVTPHIEALKQDIKRALQVIARDVARRAWGKMTRLAKGYDPDIRGILEQEFNIKVVDKTDGVQPLAPVLSALYTMLTDLCESSLIDTVLKGYSLMTVVLYPGETIPTGCYRGAMADYEVDEATLYVAVGRSLDRGPLELGTGAHNVGKDFYSIVAHELGHVIMPKVEEANGKKFSIVFDERSKEDWARDVSTYAGTSDHECFAECFAAFTSPAYVRGVPAVVLGYFQAAGINPRLLSKASKKKPKPSDRAVNRILKAVDDADWVILVDKITPELLGAFSRAGYDDVAAGSFDISFDLIDKKAVAYAGDRAAELVTGLKETTRKNLRGDIEDAISEGWSRDELIDHLEDNYGFSETRSGLIARTELAEAHTHGRIAIANEMGATGKRSLLSADHDDKLDCYCPEAEEAGTVSMDESFVDGEDDYDFPPYHPNCWCDWTPEYGAK